MKKSYSVGDTFCVTVYNCCQGQARLVDHVKKSYSVSVSFCVTMYNCCQGQVRLVDRVKKSYNVSVSFCVTVYNCCQGQARLVDHVKKSYSVGDISLANSSADFVDNQERVEDSDDDELDNRRIAEQYNLEVAEMTAASTGSAQQPSSDRGNTSLLFCHTMLCICRVYFRPLKICVVLPHAIVKGGRATPRTYKNTP